MNECIVCFVHWCLFGSWWSKWSDTAFSVNGRQIRSGDIHHHCWREWSKYNDMIESASNRKQKKNVSALPWLPNLSHLLHPAINPRSKALLMILYYWIYHSVLPDWYQTCQFGNFQLNMDAELASHACFMTNAQEWATKLLWHQIFWYQSSIRVCLLACWCQQVSED